MTPTTVGGLFPLDLPSTADSLDGGDDGRCDWRHRSSGKRAHHHSAGHRGSAWHRGRGTAGYAGCGDIGVDCQIYKFTLAADADVNVLANWEGTSDVGIYFLASDGTTAAGDASCDANGNGDTAQPETCVQSLTAGTYFMAVVPFGPVYPTPEPIPTWVQVRLSQTPTGP